MRVLAPRFRVSLLALTIASSVLTGVGTSSSASASTTLGMRAAIVASHQIGKPYRYGATGPSSFDCSGLAWYSYRLVGRLLPRTSIQQYRGTRHIPFSQARPGDLIFMANGGTSTNASRIDHVGIYAGRGYWYVARHTGTRITRQRLWTRHLWASRP